MATPQMARKVRRHYPFIKSHQDQYAVKTMCRLLDVTRSGYYAWLNQFQTERKRTQDCFASSARRLWRATASMEHLGSFLIFEKLAKPAASIV